MSVNTTPRTWTSTEVVTAAMLNAEVRDFAEGLQDAWDSWTPTFAGFTQGNGTVVAKYLRIGKTIFYRILFTAGSTSSFSSAMTFSLPVAINSDYTAGVSEIGRALFVDGAAGGTRTVGGVYVASAGSSLAGMVVDRVADYTTSVIVTGAGGGVPWTWANTDTFSCSGIYEAA